MAKTKTGPTAKVIVLLKRRPHTVIELCKATGASVVHVRSILYGIEDVKVQKQPAKYSLGRRS